MYKKLIASTLVATTLVTGGVVGYASAQDAANPPSVTMQQAMDAALAEVPGEIQEIELEREDGTRLYEVEIVNADGDEMEVEIDAETGAVVSVDADDDKDCGKKKRKSRG